MYEYIRDSFVQHIQKAIQGEYNAIICYEQLAKLAPNEQEQKRILEIRKDEMRHYQIFMQFYTLLTQQQPTIQQPKACVTPYKEGLLDAFSDEQTTVDFYLTLSDEATIPYMKEQLRRIAADEQNHAVWFLSFLR